MSRIERMLRIELRSDLCAGSGYSYAGVVDSDTCYDDCGIPYIPAKRIKGCMRDVLEGLLYAKYADCSDDLFGVPGISDYTGDDKKPIRIGNAYVDNYDTLRGALIKIREAKGGKCINVQDVLGRFTHVVAQTALEDGVAKTNSLRYTRVINKYSPIKGKAGSTDTMVFWAKISFEEDDEEKVKDIVKGLRHLGLKRNRGFGYVKCSLEENKEIENKLVSIIKTKGQNGKTRIWFAIKNVEPLVISSTDDCGSLNYIPGQKVLGILAGRYLKKGGNPDSEEFKNLFLNGETVFSHLYPYDGGKLYYPAPGYLNSLKKTKKLVYTLKKSLPDKTGLSEEYNYTDGNQPKLLKDKFAFLGQNHEVSVCEVKKDIVYHNRHEKDDVERMLYGTEVISSGQMFGGFIETGEEEAKVLAGLLGFKEEKTYPDGISVLSCVPDSAKNTIYFGKSRSAQYGLAEFVSMEKKPLSAEFEGIPFEKDKPVLVTFLSDAAFLDENSEYTVYRDGVRRSLCRELFGEDYKNKVDINIPEEYLSFIKTTLITGFLGTWNLRKYPIPAVKAGSYLVIVPKEDFIANRFFVGERTLEGYGLVRYDKAEKFIYEGPRETDASDSNSNAHEEDMNDHEKRLLSEMLAPVAAQRWLEKKVYENLESEELKTVTNSAVGRWKLMLMESCEKGYDDSAFEDFENRIESIRNEGTKEAGRRFVRLIKKYRSSKPGSDDIWNLLEQVGINEEARSKLIKDKWFDFAMYLVSYRKYVGGERS